MCLFSRQRGTSHPQRFQLCNAYFFPNYNGKRTKEQRNDNVTITLSVGTSQLPCRHGWSMKDGVCDDRQNTYIFHLWPLLCSRMCPPAVFYWSRDVRVAHRRKTFRDPCSNPWSWVCEKMYELCLWVWPLTHDCGIPRMAWTVIVQWSLRGQSAGVRVW